MASGVLYDGGMGMTGEFEELMEHTLSRKLLNSWRWEFKNVFIGSIHNSLDPKVVMFARPCRDFAIKVSVRRAFVLG
jgi:hypothetical protein